MACFGVVEGGRKRWHVNAPDRPWTAEFETTGDFDQNLRSFFGTAWLRHAAGDECRHAGLSTTIIIVEN